MRDQTGFRKGGRHGCERASIEVLKTHKRWADVYSLISIVLVVGLVSVTALLADAANADMATRVGMFVTIVAVVIVVNSGKRRGSL